MRIEGHSWSPGEVIPLLRRVSFFANLPDGDLHQLIAIVQKATADEDEIIFSEGDGGDALYVVRDGAVELSMARQRGGTEEPLLSRPGNAFGETALLSDAPRRETARAASPSTLLRVDRESFRGLLGNNPLALGILASLSETLRPPGGGLVDEEPAEAGGSGGGTGPAEFGSAEFGFAEVGSAEAGSAAMGAVEMGPAEMSRLLQRGMIPLEAPRIRGFDIAAGTNLEEGGEGRTVWDFAELKDGRTALVTLNVQGDGLPPGHYLAMTRSLLREIARDHSGLDGLLARVNSGLAAAVVEGMEQYVEAGILLFSDGAVEWAGAGRCPGAVIRRSGVFEEFSSHGPPLGMLEGFLYGTQQMELGAGDAVIVLSAASQGLFRGAADLVVSLQGKPVGEVVTLVHKALKKARSQVDLETSVLFARRQ
ncbi:MAG: cyclic nucleotide-binding domain-containing protein [Longimicrobiales bacterium]